jgi:hypothetical protein
MLEIPPPRSPSMDIWKSGPFSVASTTKRPDCLGDDQDRFIEDRLAFVMILLKPSFQIAAVDFKLCCFAFQDFGGLKSLTQRRGGGFQRRKLRLKSDKVLNTAPECPRMSVAQHHSHAPFPTGRGSAPPDSDLLPL